jgi:FkbM family methyltransferase
MFWFRLKKLGQIISDPFLVSALLKGSAAGVEHRFVLRNFNCDYIVDVGANRGQFALIARKVFPRAKIHSFEPLEEPAQIFKKIFGNDPNVIFYPYAIGREKTTSTIHVTKDDDSSSMLPITKTQSSLFPGATEKETRQVTILPLSQALGNTPIPPASLLKIDVQGFELDVLQGCEDILNRFSHLYIECSFIELYEGQALAHQIIAWLEQRSFILVGVYNLYYQKNGMAVQGDFLFAQKK